MGENKVVVVSTPKRFTFDVIGGHILWGFVYALLYLAATFALSLLVNWFQINNVVGLVILTIGMLALNFLLMKLCWKSAVKSAYNRGNIYKKDIPQVMKGVKIYVIVILLFGAILTGVNFVNEITEINATIEALKLYGENNLFANAAYNSAKQLRVATYITTIISEIVTIVINVYLVSYAKKIITEKARNDSHVEGCVPTTKRISLFVVAIIIYGAIIAIPVLIAAILLVANLGTDSMQNATNNMGSIINSSIDVVLENEYANLRDLLTMSYADLKYEASKEGNNTVTLNKAVKEYSSVLTANGFEPVNNELSETNTTVVYSLTKSNRTLYAKIILKKDGSFEISKLENYTPNNDIQDSTTTNPSESQDTVNKPEKEDEDVKVENTLIIGKLDSAKDWVYTTQGSGNYVLPKININSEAVSKINDEIANKVKPAITNGQKYGEPSGIIYNWYTNNNVLSLVIKMSYSNSVNTYLVYNVNTKTGNVCTNKELLALKEMSEAEFLSKAKVAYGEKFKTKYNFTSREDMDSFDAELYDKTISSNNYSINEKMFLSSNGELTVVARIYSMAGVETYNELVTIK